MFDAILNQPVLPLTQSQAYASALEMMGVTVEHLHFQRQGYRIAHAVMQSRWVFPFGWIGMISRGPVWSELPDARVLADDLAELKHPVILNADGMLRHDLKGAGFFPLMSPASIAQLDLSGDDETRRARMHQKWRNRLVRAENSDLKIASLPMSDNHDHWLLQAENAQRRQRGYRGLPTRFVVAFVRSNPGQATVFSAYHKGELVAAMLFLRHGPTATYHIGHTTQKGRDLNAHTLLLSRAADRLAELGVDMLELGTIDTVNAPGLARFKLGSGAVARELSGTWLYSRALAPLARRLPNGGA